MVTLKQLKQKSVFTLVSTYKPAMNGKIFVINENQTQLCQVKTTKVCHE